MIGIPRGCTDSLLHPSTCAPGLPCFMRVVLSTTLLYQMKRLCGHGRAWIGRSPPIDCICTPPIPALALPLEQAIYASMRKHSKCHTQGLKLNRLFAMRRIVPLHRLHRLVSAKPICGGATG